MEDPNHVRLAGPYLDVLGSGYVITASKALQGIPRYILMLNNTC